MYRQAVLLHSLRQDLHYSSCITLEVTANDEVVGDPHEECTPTYPDVVFDWKKLDRQLAEKREACRGYRARRRESTAVRQPRHREAFYSVYDPITRTVYADEFPSSAGGVAALLDAILHIDRTLKDVACPLPAPLEARTRAKLTRVRDDFGIQNLIMVGDRGMITGTRIGDLRKLEGMDWVTALKAPAIAKLSHDGPLQMSLFDTHSLAEITHPDYPGERLVCCHNPVLAADRARTREELLAATENDLATIRKAADAGRLKARTRSGSGPAR